MREDSTELGSARGIPRRRFLVLAGSGTAFLVFDAPRATARALWAGFAQLSGVPYGGSFRVLRASDQLNLTFELLNLQRIGNQLVAIDGGLPSYLRVALPPQHTDEEVTTAVGSTAVLDHRSAGESRLVFEVSPPIDYFLPSLLAWDQYPLLLDPRAYPNTATPPFPTGEPELDFTVLELPEGLFLSPGSAGRFVTRADAVTHNDVTEVWMARLGRMTDGQLLEPPDGQPNARVIWTPDYVDAPAAIVDTGDPYTRAISNFDRKQLVRAMGDHGDTVEYPGHETADIRQLWVSSAGAFLDIDGEWNGTGPVAAWQHRVVTGRDVSVRIVARGFLAPFGHPASVVTISERQFGVDPNDEFVAQLEQKEFLSVGSSHVTAPRPHAPDGDRRSVFRDVRLKTGGLIEINRGVIHSGGAIDTDHAFVPLDSNNDPVELKFRATDRAGNSSSFRMPVAFVRSDQAFDPDPGATAARVVDYFNQNGSTDRRDVAFSDQDVAFADETDPGSGRTTLRTDSIVFNAVHPPAGVTLSQLRNDSQPAFFPSIELARVRDDDADAVSGNGGPAFSIELGSDWIEHGNGAGNFGAAFATVLPEVGDEVLVSFSGDTSGLAAPALAIGQIGQVLGPSATLPSAGSSWNPIGALGSTGTLFGTIPLEWLFAAFNVGSDLAADLRIPRFGRVVLPGLPGLPDELCRSFDWEPAPKSVVIGGTRIFCVASDLAAEGLENPFSGPSSLALHIETCVPLGDTGIPGAPEQTVELTLTNFALQFPPAAPIFAIYCARLGYLDMTDTSGGWTASVRQVEFTGALNFLDPVQSLLDGVFGAFDVDVRDDEIAIDLDIPLPSINLGVFGMSNLRVGVGLDIPFDGDPVVVRFSFGTREDPFTLTVLGVGGFGSIELELAPHPAGLVRAEIVMGVILEIAVDVIVARGAISAGIGLAIEIESAQAMNDATGQMETIDEVTLTGSLECVGEIEVLGILTITVEFLLALEYQVNQRLLAGEVTISVEVDATIAKTEVEFSVRQEFSLDSSSGPAAAFGRAAPAARALAGPTGGSTFAFVDRFETATIWSEHCDAFA